MADRVVVRRAEPDDSEGVHALLADDISLHRSRFGNFSVPRLIESSFLSVVATDADSGLVLGFAAFLDSPPALRHERLSAPCFLRLAAQRYGVEGLTVASTLWLGLFVVADDGASLQAEAAKKMLHSVFATLPSLESVLLPLPATVQDMPPLTNTGLFQTYDHQTQEEPAALAAALGASQAAVADRIAGLLAVCERAAVLPRLSVRRAAIEDFDDMAPVMDGRSEVVRSTFGEYFLADVMSTQSESRASLVGCDARTGSAVALVAASTDVPLDSLEQAFDLSVFAGLRKRSQEQVLADRLGSLHAARRRRDWLSVLEDHASELEQLFDAAVDLDFHTGGRRAAAAEESKEPAVDGEGKEEDVEGEDRSGSGPGSMAGEEDDEEAGVAAADHVVGVDALAAVLDERGQAWGYQSASGKGVGTDMLTALTVRSASPFAGRIYQWRPRAGQAGSLDAQGGSAADGSADLHDAASRDGGEEEEEEAVEPPAGVTDGAAAGDGAAEPAATAGGSGASGEKKSSGPLAPGNGLRRLTVDGIGNCFTTVASTNPAVTAGVSRSVLEMGASGIATASVAASAQVQPDARVAEAASALLSGGTVSRAGLSALVEAFAAGRARRRRRRRLADWWGWGESTAAFGGSRDQSARVDTQELAEAEERRLADDGDGVAAAAASDETAEAEAGGGGGGGGGGGFDGGGGSFSAAAERRTRLPNRVRALALHEFDLLAAGIEAEAEEERQAAEAARARAAQQRRAARDDRSLGGSSVEGGDDEEDEDDLDDHRDEGLGGHNEHHASGFNPPAGGAVGTGLAAGSASALVRGGAAGGPTRVPLRELGEGITTRSLELLGVDLRDLSEAALSTSRAARRERRVPAAGEDLDDDDEEEAAEEEAEAREELLRVKANRAGVALWWCGEPGGRTPGEDLVGELEQLLLEHRAEVGGHGWFDDDALALWRSAQEQEQADESQGAGGMSAHQRSAAGLVELGSAGGAVGVDPPSGPEAWATLAVSRRRLMAALELWTAAVPSVTPARLVVAPAPAPGSQPLEPAERAAARALAAARVAAWSLGVPVVDVQAAVAEAAARREARLAADRSRREEAERLRKEEEEKARKKRKKKDKDKKKHKGGPAGPTHFELPQIEAVVDTADRLGESPFAALARRLRQPDCWRGFVLVNLPTSEGPRAVADLAAVLVDGAVAPQALLEVRAPATVTTPTAPDAAASAAGPSGRAQVLRAATGPGTRALAPLRRIVPSTTISLALSDEGPGGAAEAPEETEAGEEAVDGAQRLLHNSIWAGPGGGVASRAPGDIDDPEVAVGVLGVPLRLSSQRRPRAPESVDGDPFLLHTLVLLEEEAATKLVDPIAAGGSANAEKAAAMLAEFGPGGIGVLTRLGFLERVDPPGAGAGSGRVGAAAGSADPSPRVRQVDAWQLAGAGGLGVAPRRRALVGAVYGAAEEANPPAPDCHGLALAAVDALRSALVREGLLAAVAEAAAVNRPTLPLAEAAGAVAGPGPSNCIGVTLYGSQEEHESRAVDLLAPVFDALGGPEDKDYLVLTLPHAAPESPLVTTAPFVRVPPRPGGTPSQILYVLHAAALEAPRTAVARLLTPADLPALTRLVDPMPTAVELLADVNCTVDGASGGAAPSQSARAVQGRRAVVFESESGELLGGAVVALGGKSRELSDEGVEAMSHAYDLNSLLALQRQGGVAACAELLHFVLNPIFIGTSTVRSLLRQLMGAVTEPPRVDLQGAEPDPEALQAAARSTPVSVLLFRGGQEASACPAGAALPTMCLVRPRPVPHLSPEELAQKQLSGLPAPPANCDPRKLDFPLFLQCGRLLSEPKTVANHRVVVIGASDCGLATLAALRTIAFLHLPALTLLSPGGLLPRAEEEAAAAAVCPPHHLHEELQLNALQARLEAQEAKAGSGEATPRPAEQGTATLPLDSPLPDAPFLPVPGTEPGLLRRLGIYPGAPDLTVVDGGMVGVDRPHKAVRLAGGASLPYDLLVLAPGLAEPSPHSIRFHGYPDSLPPGVFSLSGALDASALEEEVAGLLEAVPNGSALPDSLLSLHGPDGGQDGPPQGGEGDGGVLRVGVEQGRDVVVYGDTIPALTAVNAMVERGVDPRRILLLRPNQSEVELAHEREAAGGATGDGEEEEEAAAAPAMPLPFLALEPSNPVGRTKSAAFPTFAVERSLQRMGVGVMAGWKVDHVEEATGPTPDGADEPETVLVLELQSRQPAKEGGGRPGALQVRYEEQEAGEVDDVESDDELGGQKRQRARINVGPRTVRVDARLVVFADQRDVDRGVFAAVNRCGLVFDGRLVVDHRLCTADRDILAGGTVAKFSRRYRWPMPVGAYSSDEVGRLLAQQVMQRVDPFDEEEEEGGDGGDGTNAASIDENGVIRIGAGGGPRGSALLPRLTEPKRLQAILPGGWRLFRCALPDYDYTAGRGLCRELVTHSRMEDDERMTRIILDRFGRVAELEVCSRLPVEALNLSRLLGLHSAYLRGLVRDFDSGRVTDLVDHLRGGWASALYHDRCRELIRGGRDALLEGDEAVASLVREVAERTAEGAAPERALQSAIERGVGTVGAKLPAETRRQVESATISFLKDNRRLLPGYFLPGHGVA